MVAKYANNASGKLGSAITTSATTLILQTGQGALFPSPTGGDYFPLTLLKSDGSLEIVKCTARAADTLTIVRAQEGTTAKAFDVGDRASLRITAGSLTDFIANKQPLDATLTALAALVLSADKMVYSTADDAFALTPLTAFARSLLDDADAATMLDTLTAISKAQMVGSVTAFAKNTAPAGFLKCNGAAISRTSYAALFAAIGTTFGAGDGSTTFNLPDLRGEFVRGLDDARGIDSSRAIGSWQDGQNASHNHGASLSAHNHSFSASTSGYSHSHTVTTKGGTFTAQTQGSLAGAWYSTVTGSTSTDTHSHSLSGTTDSQTPAVTVGLSGGTEVRVRNVALLYCIKY